MLLDCGRNIKRSRCSEDYLCDNCDKTIELCASKKNDFNVKKINVLSGLLVQHHQRILGWKLVTTYPQVSISVRKLTKNAAECLDSSNLELQKAIGYLVSNDILAPIKNSIDIFKH